MAIVREFLPQRCPDDFVALVPAYLEIWNAPENLPFLSLDGHAFAEAQVREWFGCHLSAGVRYLGAVAGECVAGLLALRLDRDRENLEITGIAVRPEFKRRGIGRTLMSRAIDLARGNGYAAVDIQVFSTNKAMLRLLLDLDFVPVQIRRQAPGMDLMHLRLALPRHMHERPDLRS